MGHSPLNFPTTKSQRTTLSDGSTQLPCRITRHNKKEPTMAENNETRSKTSHRTPGQTKRMNREYDSLPRKVDERSNDNKNRRDFERRGLVHKGDGKDIDHKRSVKDGGSNSPKNLRVISASKNRSKSSKSI
jgi:hypothetical protein